MPEATPNSPSPRPNQIDTCAKGAGGGRTGAHLSIWLGLGLELLGVASGMVFGWFVVGLWSFVLALWSFLWSPSPLGVEQATHRSWKVPQKSQMLKPQGVSNLVRPLFKGSTLGSGSGGKLEWIRQTYIGFLGNMVFD